MATVNSVDPATLQKNAFFDRSVGAAMLAGGCTFLNVYATQPLLPVLRQEFHGTEFHVSLTISAATVAVAIIGPLVGWAAEAIGRKRVIVPALFALVVPTALAATSCSIGVKSTKFSLAANMISISGTPASRLSRCNAV